MNAKTNFLAASITRRRDFLRTSALTSVGAVLGKLDVASFAHAAGSDQIKIALIGCGGRGTGAAANAIKNAAGAKVKLVAMADAFGERLDSSLASLQESFQDNIDVSKDRRFVGLDAYEKAIACGADVVLLCTPPGFRPSQFEAAVKAGKHVFMEKPVAVDAPGYRRMKAANEEAKKKGLAVAVGHHLRHSRNHREVVRQIHDGLIGDLLFSRAYFNTQGIWNRERKPGQTEMQYQVMNWYHFVWLSGDHLVEQHVHGIDACNWFARGHPVDAQGTGGRQVRIQKDIGELFDHHHIEFTYADGVKSFSECRHIPNCWNSATHHAHGTKGFVSFEGNDAVTIHLKGRAPQRLRQGSAGHQVEWDDFLAAVLARRPYNEADEAADSTMTAILGRMATYSGQLVEWSAAVKSDLRYQPEQLTWDSVPKSKPGPDGIYPCATPGVTKAL